MTERGEALERFQSRIGIHFEDLGLLDEALTHSSFTNEHPDWNVRDNERLEFLGDAILDFLVGEWIYMRYPSAREGVLTSVRARIVRAEGLASFAEQIDLGEYLRLGRGEAATGGRARAANLCAAFEALVGAIYLDQGIEQTRAWVYGFLEQGEGEIARCYASRGPKSVLQEYAQGSLHVTPTYRIVHEEGPDHAKIFIAQVLVGRQVWGEGAGPSKREAEKAAAEAALKAHSVSR
ncbi:MAG: ribonuclease III [Chloroflexota bacterium]|nr:ribonuclease III [Chloroflexota bacterium]